VWIGPSFYAFVAIGAVEGGLGVLLPSIRDAHGLSPAAVTLLFLSQVTGYLGSAAASGAPAVRLGLAPMLLLAAASLAGGLLHCRLGRASGVG
jgi:fucose permease